MSEPRWLRSALAILESSLKLGRPLPIFRDFPIAAGYAYPHVFSLGARCLNCRTGVLLGYRFARTSRIRNFPKHGWRIQLARNDCRERGFAGVRFRSHRTMESG